MSEAVALDTPQNRGYEWEKRSCEVKEQTGYTCQRCGDVRGGKGNGYVAIETHHIVKGARLPVADARIDCNLAAVCETCHGWMERQPKKLQFASVGRTDMAQVLAMLEQGRCTAAYIDDIRGIGILNVYAALAKLERLRLAVRLSGSLYELEADPRDE